MKKSYLAAAAVLLMAATCLVMANKASVGDGFCITISPKTLSLNSEDTVVTVHSNIPYVLADRVSLMLNDIPALYTKSDACGDLVVKFDRADVKGIVEPGQATLTLYGTLVTGMEFAAQDTITVK